MDTKYLKNVAAYVLTAAVSLLVILLIIRALSSLVTSEVETMLTEVATERATEDFEAYVMRSETVLYSARSGGLSYSAVDGEHVAAGRELVNVYSEGGGEDARRRIIEIDRKIGILEDSNISGSITVTDTAALDSEINALFGSLRNGVENGDLAYAVRKRDELLILLNRRSIITRTVQNYDEEITRLSNEKLLTAADMAGAAETVKAPGAGYFYTSLDGYETAFHANEVPTLTVERFDRLKETQPRDYSGYGGYGVGKLVTAFTWYIVCESTQDMLRNFRYNGTYTVVFPYSSDTELRMTLTRIVTETNGERVLLVFSTGEIPENFNFLRRQPVQIVKASYTGYRVPISAVRINDGRQGVYVLDNRLVRFREIVPLTEVGGYFIVARRDPLNDEYYYNKLNLHDLIITRGKNLYESKIIS